MKPLILVVIFFGVLSLVAVCSIVKFATEINEHEKIGQQLREEPERDNLVLKFSRNLGVITLRDNHSYVASERFPYIAAITSKSRELGLSFSCFGAVILMNWILTAAHCKIPGRSHRVLLYFDYVRNNTQTYPVVLWRLHEGYSPNGTSPLFDIAVAKISVNVVPIIQHAAVFNNKRVKQIQASVWKTVMTMDKTTFLTNDLEEYDADLASPVKCYEHYGVTLDELDDTLICVDMSKRSDCFVTEFGPIFAYETNRIVGVLAVKPRDCDGKISVFTNVSAYFNWIIRMTGTSDESPDVVNDSPLDSFKAIKLPSF